MPKKIFFNSDLSLVFFEIVHFEMQHFFHVSTRNFQMGILGKEVLTLPKNRIWSGHVHKNVPKIALFPDFFHGSAARSSYFYVSDVNNILQKN